MKFLRKVFTPFEFLIFAVIVLSIVVAITKRVSAQVHACMPDAIAIAMVDAQAGKMGVEPIALTEADEIKRYIDVLNEKPPQAGPADLILILTHPLTGLSGVWLFHNSISCDQFIVGPDLHRRAWQAAKGTPA